MSKKLTVLLLAVFLMSSVMAQAQTKFNRVKADKMIASQDKNRELIETTLLSEDFSKFTAGSEDAPDGTRLDDPETGMIDDTYFNTPGWSGLEVYQAGGCAYVTFSDEYYETGMIITPLINTEGAIYIKCRMRSDSPYGDYAGYNICDENFEAIDANYTEIGNEWTEVSWFTTSGLEDSYVYIYSYESNVYIDDIEITVCSLPTPVMLEETNITDNSFTANWESVDGADSYTLDLYAQHTATGDETYYYSELNFNDITSAGTYEAPEIVVEMAMDYNEWYIYMPALINEAIGVTGQYVNYNQYGFVQSPVLDLTSDDGNVNISFKAYGNVNDEMEINLFSAANGYYDIASSETVKIENIGWNEYSVDLTDGDVDSYIVIKYLGSGYMFFDDITLSQQISEGDVKVNRIQRTETESTNLDIFVDEKYAKDILFYQLHATQYVWATDDYTGEEYILGEITSDLTEPRMSPTNGVGIESVKTASAAYAYFNGDQLNVFNPGYEMVSVYNINGVCLYNSNINGTLPMNFNNGIYIVKIGGKAMKVVK